MWTEREARLQSGRQAGRQTNRQIYRQAMATATATIDSLGLHRLPHYDTYESETWP